MTKNDKNVQQITFKNEINRSVISSRALLCVSQSIIVHEIWDPKRQCRKATTRQEVVRSSEKKFSEKTRHSSRI